MAKRGKELGHHPDILEGQSLEAAEADGRRILDRVVAEYQPAVVFAGFSGGHDSLVAAHFASQHPSFTGCLHINTGIGIEQTRQFVRDTCAEHDWLLKEYHPPVSYEEIVLKWGFPGPKGHTIIYNRLKERCLRQWTREYKRFWKDRVVVVTGVRRAESRRRMGTLTEINRDGARVWCAPIINWTAKHKAEYIAKHGLKTNPVVALLCMSGECLCGAFAKPGEREEIELWFPDAAAEISRIEALAREAGVHAVWGTPPPRREKTEKASMALCHSCEAKKEALE